MRLINVESRKLEEFISETAPPYAILSHTWETEEVTFSDYQRGNFKHLKGYQKIDHTCKQAAKDGIEYVWVDTCTIDKSSSAELSEAINSMFRWYKQSKVCYVYLSDVRKAHFDTDFGQARWFTRGWTLQELLAPTELHFFDKDWTYLADKVQTREEIARITGIFEYALTDSTSIRAFSISARMSWAADRSTTRTEDMAYCLLGIFDLNMPLLYGEGSKAFVRLQEELLRTSNDHTLFAWGFHADSKAHTSTSILRACTWTSVFAKSPRDFRHGGTLYEGTSGPDSAISLTNQGVQARLPMIDLGYMPWEPRPIDGQFYRQGVNRQLSCAVALLSAYVSRQRSQFVGIALGLWCDADAAPQYHLQRISTLGGSTIIIPPSIALNAKVRDVCIHQQKFNKNKIPSDHFFSSHLRTSNYIVVEAEPFPRTGYRVQCVSTVNAEWVPDEHTVYFSGFGLEHFVLLTIVSRDKEVATLCVGYSPPFCGLQWVDRKTKLETFSQLPRALLMNFHITSVQATVPHESPDGSRIKSISAKVHNNTIMSQLVRSLKFTFERE